MTEELRPWVVREVPERTRRQVKLYAVEHAMTMARALEVIVDAVHRRRDRQLLDSLFHVYRLVMADDFEEARTEAERVQQLLKIEPRLSDMFSEGEGHEFDDAMQGEATRRRAERKDRRDAEKMRQPGSSAE